ncbi:MAG TPA: aldehyde ferredoxin oxidoreductase [Euryarchaeota archaeon]|nr:aldehyde ferredoxin oxidoreductase [Euryarchaeota archaeon]
MAVSGYNGKVLRVDLGKGTTSVEPLKEEWAEKFIGGKGLGARYLWDELKPGTDPLSPDNVLMVWTGPLGGTMIPLSGRYVIITKSPATDTFLDSYVGGHVAHELKWSGFDGVIINGKSDKPVYLSIKDGKAELRDASKIWGKDIGETQKIIREELGDDKTRVISIGPAGENMSKIACIGSDLYRQAGRGGGGAVMGSKNLKAIAVRGTLGMKVDNIEKLVEQCKKYYQDALKNPDNDWAITDGTPLLIDASNDAGILPTNNFQSGVFDKKDGMNSEALKAKVGERRKACLACVLACGTFSKVRDGPFKGAAVEGPEYETLGLCGSNCGIDDINAIVKFNIDCDFLGIDTISAGATVGMAMEMYEKGLLTKEDTDGLELKFGNVDAYVKMPKIMAYRKGKLGELLGDGASAAAKKLGGDAFNYVVQVKGLEYPAYDPRGTIGMAIAYATSDRGACHQRAWPAASEAYGDLDPWTTEGKAELVAGEQRDRAIKYSMIYCDFLGIGLDGMAEHYNAVTGKNATQETFEQIGKRVWNLTRAFNAREGFTSKDDTLPYKIANNPMPDGKTKGKVIPQADFDKIMKEYYAWWNWDDQGRPTKEALKALQLDDIAAQLSY